MGLWSPGLEFHTKESLRKSAARGRGMPQLPDHSFTLRPLRGSVPSQDHCCPSLWPLGHYLALPPREREGPAPCRHHSLLRAWIRPRPHRTWSKHLPDEWASLEKRICLLSTHSCPSPRDRRHRRRLLSQRLFCRPGEEQLAPAQRNTAVEITSAVEAGLHLYL